jgi:hypothetical protein
MIALDCFEKNDAVTPRGGDGYNILAPTGLTVEKVSFRNANVRT